MVKNVKAAGFNPDIFVARIPTSVHVNQSATVELQVKELLKSGKSFSASGYWSIL
jgi:hypothetical protein